MAEIYPDMQLIDGDETEAIAAMEEREGWDTYRIQNQYLCIHTSALEEKYLGCEVLCNFARDLNTHFYPYVERTAGIMLPLLQFIFHEDIRKVAAECLPYLVRCLVTSASQVAPAAEAAVKLFHAAVQELIAAIGKETDPSILLDLIDSLANCVEAAKPCTRPTPHALGQLGVSLNRQIAHLLARTVERNKMRSGEEGDCDVETEEQLDSEDLQEDDLLQGIENLIRSLLEVLHAVRAAASRAATPPSGALTARPGRVWGGGVWQDMLPFVGAMVPTLLQLLASQPCIAPRQYAICIVDDVIEFAGPACTPLILEHFQQPLLRALEDASPDVQQAAAYGVGVAGLTGDERLRPFCYDALRAIFRAMTTAKMADPAAVYARDNMVSAVAKVISSMGESLPLAEILPIWLSWLPIADDNEEARYVYGFLCRLIESNCPMLFGERHEHLPLVVKVRVMRADRTVAPRRV